MEYGQPWKVTPALVSRGHTEASYRGMIDGSSAHVSDLSSQLPFLEVRLEAPVLNHMCGLTWLPPP